MSEDHDDKTQVLRRAPVAAAVKVAPAQLTCVDTSVLKDGVGAQISLREAEVSVGRDAENQVSLHAQGVSRYHARVFFDSGSWTVEDLGSTNGTRINNSKLVGKQNLNDGDTVAFGRACYKFQLIDNEDEGATTGIDIDLGAADKTMVMRPGIRPDAVPKAAAKPTAKDPLARTAATAKPVAAGSAGGSNAVLWIIVVAAFAGLIFGGAKLLGFI